jgi:hypothetical protein
MADRDCEAGNVCYAYWYDLDTFAGLHLCAASDPRYGAAGDACGNGAECDSGVCAGTCSTTDVACNTGTDCDSGVCTGTCREHCRSQTDCGSAEVCTLWPMETGATASGFVPVCGAREGSGSGALGSACTSASQCRSEWCISGVCTTPCGTSDDCASISGTACEVVSFVDASATPVYAGAFCLR